MGDVEDQYRKKELEALTRQAQEKEAIVNEILKLIPQALAHAQTNPPEICMWVNDGTTVHVGWELCIFFADGDNTDSVALLNNGRVVITWFQGGSFDRPITVKQYLTDDTIRTREVGELRYLLRGLKQLLPPEQPTKKPRRKWFDRS